MSEVNACFIPLLCSPETVNCEVRQQYRLLISPRDYQRQLNQPPGNGHKINDWEEFREFASSHGDKTQVEMARLWKELS